jgi:hypothetical protein
MRMIMESRREYEKRRKRKMREEEMRYERIKKEEERFRREQAKQREKREEERELEEKQRRELIAKEKKRQRVRERRELKLRDQKRKEELEKVLKTTPPEIKETKSSIDRVRAVCYPPLSLLSLCLCSFNSQIKEAKKLQLEKEIERKEYFEKMRKKYFYSKPPSPSHREGGAGAARGINLRMFLKTT